MKRHIEADPVATVVEDINGRSRVHQHGGPLLIVAVTAAFLVAIAVGVGALSGVFDRAVANREFLNAIQEERARASLESCRQQNARHDNTIERLDEAFADLPPAEQARQRAERDLRVALIDALAPVRDCKRLVERTVVKGAPTMK